MFKSASGFHRKNIIVERLCCENPDGKVRGDIAIDTSAEI
jgi:hypothetical protein